MHRVQRYGLLLSLASSHRPEGVERGCGRGDESVVRPSCKGMAAVAGGGGSGEPAFRPALVGAELDRTSSYPRPIDSRLPRVIYIAQMSANLIVNDFAA